MPIKLSYSRLNRDPDIFDCKNDIDPLPRAAKVLMLLVSAKFCKNSS